MNLVKIEKEEIASELLITKKNHVALLKMQKFELNDET